MVQIKRFLCYCIVLCFCFAIITSASLAAEPESIEITSVIYNGDEKRVTIDGVAGEGLKAVIWELWRVECDHEQNNNGQIISFRPIMLKNEEIHDSIRIAEMKDGRYLVKVANWFGGEYATAEFNVPFLSPAIIPAAKPVCGSVLEDESSLAETTILSISRDMPLFSVAPIPILANAPTFLMQIVLSIFTNISR
ncbi:MAG: hypothetical protein PHS16_01555 [Candidatus Colwellbacteria bacterium]|nr:hypothetical protein [Candidatus Colwellbacteria bacterium]MCK9497750.1 hypothetical protein [Candidatus Colwellbacteria bacterium]MDD3752605.1 hypothetical protein [Candidatus Colwellbacteria bacterium]MDD4818830.1 hypothetical protein [Candidatus Colwellbacteria bacterium]